MRAKSLSLTAFAAAVLAIALGGCGQEPASTPPQGGSAIDTTTTQPAAPVGILRVSVIPDADATRIHEQFEPLGSRLQEVTGRPVLWNPVSNYAAAVEGLLAGHLDLVWLGGYTSVQAIHQGQGKTERLVMRNEDAKFKSVFVTRAGSGIEKLDDLKGKKFAFGSESSTSGHLMPRHFLVENGIDPEETFAKITFTGKHDLTAKMVENGTVDAGALNHLVWQRLVNEGGVDTAKVQVFWTTPEYVDYCWVASTDLPAEIRAQIKKCMLDLDAGDPEDAKVLSLQSATGFLEAKDSDWDGIKRAAIAAGMLQE